MAGTPPAAFERLQSRARALPTGMQYTDQQREAIHALDHNLQIVACAGSGKTRGLGRHPTLSSRTSM